MSAEATAIPVFKAGEPGFAAKLNELGKVVGELRVALEGALERVAQLEKPAPKTATKATAAKAKPTAATS